MQNFKFLQYALIGVWQRRQEEEQEKENMKNSGLRLSDTVCTVPLGPISAHADGGPRSRVCVFETIRSAPHRYEHKFSGARVCRVTFLKFHHFSVKIGLFWGVGGRGGKS